MRQAGIAGIYRRRGRGCTRRDPGASPSDDLVEPRASIPIEPDRLWVMDVTEHPTGDGQGLPGRRARRVQPPGRGLVDRRSHPLRARRRRRADGDLAAPATRRARPSRTPTTDRQYTSWAFGRRLRGAGLLGSMGIDRRLLRQQRRRELLRDPAARAPRRAPLAHPPATRPRDLRLDRSLVQPAPPPLLLRDAQPHRLRDRHTRHDHHNPTRPPNRGKLSQSA